MADFYVNNVGGSNTSPYDTWAKGASNLAAVITFAVTAADTIYIASDHSETGSWTPFFPSAIGLQVISADRTSGEPPVTRAAGATISAGAISTACALNGSAYIYGVNFNGGTNANSAADINIGATQNGPHAIILDTCQLYCRGTSANAVIQFGNTAASGNDETYIGLINTQIGVGHAGSSITFRQATVVGVGVSLIGTAPTDMFTMMAAAGANVTFTGCDFSGLAYTNLCNVESSASGAAVRIAQSKLRSGSTPFASNSTAIGGCDFYLFDCASGDTHGLYAYYNARGSVVSDTGIFFASGAAAQSWKITTTAAASPSTPFETPWFGYYNSDVSTAISPYIEILHNINNWAATTAYSVGDRVINDTGKVYVCDTAGTSAGSGGPTGTGTDITDNTARWDYLGTSTAYQNDEVWIDVFRKTTSGSTQATLTTDRMTLLGTPADQDAGAGIGSWTGENATAWSGKCVAPSATPAEVGHIQARIVVGEPSITVYADPQIRT